MSTNAMKASDKVMFEVYREGHDSKAFRVVYFTELDDHNRELGATISSTGSSGARRRSRPSRSTTRSESA
jgi:hypothetical protein